MKLLNGTLNNLGIKFVLALTQLLIVSPIAQANTLIDNGITLTSRALTMNADDILEAYARNVENKGNSLSFEVTFEIFMSRASGLLNPRVAYKEESHYTEQGNQIFEIEVIASGDALVGGTESFNGGTIVLKRKFNLYFDQPVFLLVKGSKSKVRIVAEGTTRLPKIEIVSAQP